MNNIEEIIQEIKKQNSLDDLNKIGLTLDYRIAELKRLGDDAFYNEDIANKAIDADLIGKSIYLLTTCSPKKFNITDALCTGVYTGQGKVKVGNTVKSVSDKKFGILIAEKANRKATTLCGYNYWYTAEGKQLKIDFGIDSQALKACYGKNSHAKKEDKFDWMTYWTQFVQLADFTGKRASERTYLMTESGNKQIAASYFDAGVCKCGTSNLRVDFCGWGNNGHKDFIIRRYNYLLSHKDEINQEIGAELHWEIMGKDDQNIRICYVCPIIFEYNYNKDLMQRQADWCSKYYNKFVTVFNKYLKQF